VGRLLCQTQSPPTEEKLRYPRELILLEESSHSGSSRSQFIPRGKKILFPKVIDVASESQGRADGVDGHCGEGLPDHSHKKREKTMETNPRGRLL